MSAPIIPDTYSFILNEANEYKINEILRPPIQNMKFVRVLASNVSGLYSISCIRPSYLLESSSPIPMQIDGLVIASDKIWYEVNTEFIDRITAYVYKAPVPSVDSISITLQFVSKISS